MNAKVRYIVEGDYDHEWENVLKALCILNGKMLWRADDLVYNGVGIIEPTTESLPAPQPQFIPVTTVSAKMIGDRPLITPIPPMEDLRETPATEKETKPNPFDGLGFDGIKEV